MSDTLPLKETPNSGLLQPRLGRLSSDWRELAGLYDSEIQRTKTDPPTLILSDDEKVRYEQASRTFRFCAAALDSETNVDVDASADKKTLTKPHDV